MQRRRHNRSRSRPAAEATFLPIELSPASMAQQPNLFPPNPQDAQQAGDERPAASVRGRTSISWVTRIEVMLRILVRLYLGLLVMALPWLTFWTQNNLFTYDPLLLALAGSGFVRGVVSGLGLLNVVLAVLEAKNAQELR